VHSVPEYLRRRFNAPTHLFNALTFAVASVLTAGINLYALALVLEKLIGWPIPLGVVVAAGFVLVYITLGGLSGAIYTEVLQFFVIVAGLIPVVVIGLVAVGGWSGLQEQVAQHVPDGQALFHPWRGTAVGHWTNPLGDWIGIVMGLGFVLSFGYWTTNFAEVQRALSAKDLSAAQRTPLIGAYPKIFIPALTIIPGLVAIAVVPNIGKQGAPTYNEAIPELMGRFLPNGVLGIALTGLLAAFMAGMAANVSSFNTVFTYDIWRPYIVSGRSDRYYLGVGRIITVIGILIAIGTSFIAAGYENIMNYIQLLFSFFNAPLFATFIIAMFWRRTTPWAGLAGLVAGTLGAAIMHLVGYHVGYFYPGGEVLSHDKINAQMVNFYGAIAAFVTDAVVTVVVTLVTKPKPIEELRGLVWGVPDPDAPDPAKARKPRVWWESPKLLGFVALAIVAVLSLVFI
jgi:SSS family solute:Na+ symporter